MAGDWIKMRVDLHDDPAVIGIAAATGLDEFAVTGRLHKLWAWADQHTTNGNATCVTILWLDRYLCATGFAQAMIDVGWLAVTADGISLPNYDRHSGETGKQRGLAAKRAAKLRGKSNANSNATCVTKSAPRVEKSREDNTSTNVEVKAAAPASPPKKLFDSLPIPPELDNPDCRAALDRWETHRKQIRKPLTSEQASAQLKQLAIRGSPAAIAMIDHTIFKGWQGLREPETETRHGPQPNPQYKRREL